MNKLMSMTEAAESMTAGQVFVETVDAAVWTNEQELKSFVSDAISIDGQDALRGREGVLYDNDAEFQASIETFDADTEED